MNEMMQPIQVSQDELMAISDDHLERLGIIVATAFKRRRDVLLCNRDGHTPIAGGFCVRCLERVT